MNHGDTKAQRFHGDIFVFLRDPVPPWFKTKLKHYHTNY
jgi:hypothetical protein